MSRQQRSMGGGNFGGISGHFTALGRKVAYYYIAVFVLGLLVTNWMPAPLNVAVLLGLLNPIEAATFGWWQLVTQLLVYYPDGNQILPFFIQILVFWLFAWQVEEQAGRERFLLLLVGVPLLTGLLGLPFTYLSVFQGQFAGFSVVLDSLIVAFYMMNRNAVGGFMFIIPMKLVHLIYFILAMNVLSFIARANPNLVYQLIAMGLTWLIFRYDLTLDPELWRLKRKHRQMMKKMRQFEVVPGGREDRNGPMYH